MHLFRIQDGIGIIWAHQPTNRHRFLDTRNRRFEMDVPSQKSNVWESRYDSQGIQLSLHGCNFINIHQ